MFRRRSLFLPTAFLAFLLVSVLHGNAFAASSFYDVTDDTLYSPYIQKLYDAHLITGDTDNGEETYRYRPKDSLTRAEFTKVAVGIKLAEKYGVQEDWQSKSAYEITETVLKDKLLYFHKCDNSDVPQCWNQTGADIKGVCNVCTVIGEKPFVDVAEKERNCEEERMCTPWYSEYIYYAQRKGMVWGYREGTSYRFEPDAPILRIHALKLVMADDGAVDPEADERYRRLSQTAKSRGSYYPKCLSGAEKSILSQNGGGADAEKLLKYALLADKLDFFGNTCQVFNEAGARTPEARATFLHSTMTRQEVARYFVLSTSYSPLQFSAKDDPTVEEVVSELTDKNAPEADDKALFKTPDPQLTKKAVNEINNEPINIDPAKAEMTIKQLTALGKQGRCCRSMDLVPDSNCKIITYRSYSIGEESDYNWLTYNGPSWHLATNSWDRCYVPYPDILNGYAPPPPANDYEILGRMMQRRNEIFGNLDAFYMAGHTFEQTKAYGLGEGPKPSNEIDDVNDWYKTRPARQNEIYLNLEAYYRGGHDLKQTIEYGYTSDKLPIESYWVVQWYEKKKREIEAAIAAQRVREAAARATAYRKQQAAAPQKATTPWYMSALGGLAMSYADPYVNFGKSVINYNLNQATRTSCSILDTPGMYGNPKYPFPTYLSTAPTVDPNPLMNNPVSGFVLYTGGWITENAGNPVGESIRATHGFVVEKAEEAGNSIKNTAATVNGIATGIFSLIPSDYKPIVAPARSIYNVDKGAIKGASDMAEGLFQAFKDPVGTAKGLYTVANLGYQTQRDPVGIFTGSNPAAKQYWAMTSAVQKGATDFVAESFSSQDMFEENVGRVGFEILTWIGGIGEVGTATKVTQVTKIVTTVEKAGEAAKALDKMADLGVIARGLEKVKDVTRVSETLNAMQDAGKVAEIVAKMNPGKAVDVVSGLSKVKAGGILSKFDDAKLAEIANGAKKIDGMTEDVNLALKIITQRERGRELAEMLRIKKAEIGDPVLKMRSQLDSLIEKGQPDSYIRQFKIEGNSLDNIPGATGKVDPRSLRFSQSQIIDELTRGEKLSDYIEKLRLGDKIETEFEIGIFNLDGQWYANNNRHLFAFKEANVPVNYRILDLSTNSGFDSAERYLSTYTNGEAVIVSVQP